jgi:hypothetical protein
MMDGSDFNAADVTDMINEMNRQILDGSADLLQNITDVMDKKLGELPESAANELSQYIGDLAN